MPSAVSAGGGRDQNGLLMSSSFTLGKGSEKEGKGRKYRAKGKGPGKNELGVMEGGNEKGEGIVSYWTVLRKRTGSVRKNWGGRLWGIARDIS